MGIPIKLNLDTTGTSTDNKIVNEPQAIGTSVNYRIVVPKYGAFFADTMVIVDAATGLPLTASQYYPAELYEVPSAKYGKDIYALLVITDNTVSANTLLTYQALGGEYNASMDAIIQLISTLSLDNRPVNYADIIHKPNAYPPAIHLHDVGDVYGFEYLVHSINRLRQAIEAGDSVTARSIYQYIDERITAVNAVLTTLTGVAGGYVINENKATQTIAEAAADNTLWMTPLRVKQEINAVLSTNKVTDFDFLIYYNSL